MWSPDPYLCQDLLLLCVLLKRAAWSRARSPGEARTWPPSTFCTALALTHSFTASGSGLLSPHRSLFVAFGPPTENGPTGPSLLDRPTHPLRAGSLQELPRSLETIEGRGGSGDASPST